MNAGPATGDMALTGGPALTDDAAPTGHASSAAQKPAPLIAGDGTGEDVWQAWAGLRSLPELDLDAAPRGVVVVAPHPDDEVLGVGGTMARLTAAGASVRIVAVTDGEASHPGSPTLTQDDLVGRRRAERRAALHHLGLAGCPVLRCGIPDGEVAAAEDELAERLEELLVPGAWCLATWRHDGHPDHEAVGRAATTAAARTGARLLSYPVWTWHWAVPGDDRVPWSDARRVRLDERTVLAKRAAAEAFTTQVRPLSDHPADRAILPTPVLARLVRDVEVFLP